MHLKYFFTLCAVVDPGYLTRARMNKKKNPQLAGLSFRDEKVGTRDVPSSL